jgi:hypothetical protein
MDVKVLVSVTLSSMEYVLVYVMVSLVVLMLVVVSIMVVMMVEILLTVRGGSVTVVVEIIVTGGVVETEIDVAEEVVLVVSVEVG